MKRIQEKAARQLVEKLDQEIRSRGRGSIRAVDRALGYAEGWWQHRAESGDITVHQLFAVLDHLGLDPARFVRKVLRAGTGFGLDRPRGVPPEIVSRAWHRFRSGTDGRGVGARYLETLDEQRYQEPDEVVRLSRWAVDHVELELLPGLLGVAGSSFRLLLLLDEAEHAISAGIEIAELQGNRGVAGSLLQRLAYVMADRGEHAEALRLAEDAAFVHLRSGDRVAVGKALVDQGIWLHYLGRHRESIEVHKGALAHLPEEPSRNRFTAFQCMGLAHQKLGELESALDCVLAAQEAAAGMETGAHAKLAWLHARIHADLGRLDLAASLLRDVIETFRHLHYGEAALATCELVRVQLLQHRPTEALHAALSMRALLEPLRHHKIISAAIGDLLRSAQTGLTLALVEQVKARIESERQALGSWQSLRVRTPRT